MPIINFSSAVTVLLSLVLFLLVLILGKETHKSAIPAVMLFVFLLVLSLVVLLYMITWNRRLMKLMLSLLQ